jgi:hypothetical protein
MKEHTYLIMIFQPCCKTLQHQVKKISSSLVFFVTCTCKQYMYPCYKCLFDNSVWILAPTLMVLSWFCKNVLLSDSSEDLLFQSAQATGTCKVMCFHPWSDMTLPLMEVKDIVSVIEKWAETNSDLGKTYTWVQVSTCNVSFMTVSYYYIVYELCNL